MFPFTRVPFWGYPIFDQQFGFSGASWAQRDGVPEEVRLKGPKEAASGEKGSCQGARCCEACAS